MFWGTRSIQEWSGINEVIAQRKPVAALGFNELVEALNDRGVHSSFSQTRREWTSESESARRCLFVADVSGAAQGPRSPPRISRTFQCYFREDVAPELLKRL